MTPKDLLKRVRQRPFIPFRLVVSEGATYDVRHPEQIIVARDTVVIAEPSENDGDEFYDGTHLVDLFHVVRIEPIPAKPKKGKAQPH